MLFRIGINVGDVLTEDGRLYGDGVNIAARLEGLADAGGLCISEADYTQIKNKLALRYEYIGERTVKNIAEPVRVYKVQLESDATSPQPLSAEQSGSPSVEEKEKPRRWQIAALAVVLVLSVGVGVMVFRDVSPLSSSVQKALPPAEAPATSLPNKPSLAVLPFTNMSGDPEQDYFSDGLTEDLITDLSRLSGLFVLARNSAFRYKGQAVNIKEVSQQHRVRYVVEGSIRRTDERVRINAQLIDATTEYHLWAERYDRPVQDIFALQDEIVQKIVETLGLQLSLWEQGIVERRSTENLEAYDTFLQGIAAHLRFEKKANEKARQLLERAIALDPEYATAYAWLAYTYWMEWVMHWNQDPRVLDRATDIAQQAILLDDTLPVAHRAMCFIHLWKKQHDQAITEGAEAIALDPNYAEGYTMLSVALSLSGRAKEAIELAQKALQLSPHNAFYYYSNLGTAYFNADRYDEATAAYQKSLTLNPYNLDAHIHLAIIYGQQGRQEEARAAAAEVLQVSPQFSLETSRQKYPLKDEARHDHMIAVLRQAGLK